jgi:hypothetical protein
MSECAGTSSTSSNVSAFWSRRIAIPIGAKADYTVILKQRCFSPGLSPTIAKVGLTHSRKHGEIFRIETLRIPMKRLYFSCLAAFLIFGLEGGAHAQYIWVDENGIKQYSDMPPPSSVPAKRILKKGGVPTPASAAQPASSNPPAEKKEMTIAEKNAEFRKRQIEQAEKEKKAEEENKRGVEKTKNCERTRDYKRLLDSGERIARMGKDGERNFMTDEQRAQETREAQRMLEDCR